MDCVRDKTLSNICSTIPLGGRNWKVWREVWWRCSKWKKYYNLVWLEERELNYLVIQDQWKISTHLVWVFKYYLVTLYLKNPLIFMYFMKMYCVLNKNIVWKIFWRWFKMSPYNDSLCYPSKLSHLNLPSPDSRTERWLVACVPVIWIEMQWKGLDKEHTLLLDIYVEEWGIWSRTPGKQILNVTKTLSGSTYVILFVSNHKSM